MKEDDWMRLVAAAMVLILVAPAALRRNRGRLLPTAAAWLAIGTVIALAWSWYNG